MTGSEDHSAGDTQMLPCSRCGIDLFNRDCEETTKHVDVTGEPAFGGEKGQREVPALVCPDCGEVTAL